MKLKIFINSLYKIENMFFIVLLSTQAFSQIEDSLNVNFEKSKYESVAELELKLRYKFKFNPDNNLNYLKDFFSLNELKTYSIPIFDLKESKNLKSCKSYLLELVDFKSNPNKQKVIVEFNSKVVSEFYTIDKTFNSKIDSFYKIVTQLYYHKYNYNGEFDFPILIGGPYKYFFVKERLEKKYFRFDVEGFRGTFVLKNNKVYYVTKQMPSNINLKKLSVEEEFELQKTVFIEVRENFLDEIKNEIKNN